MLKLEWMENLRSVKSSSEKELEKKQNTILHLEKYGIKIQDNLIDID